MPAVKTIRTLQAYAKRLVVVINNTEAVHVEDLKLVLAGRFPDILLFVVNRSRYIAKLADEGMTLFDLFSLGGLHAFSLRHVIPQIRELYAYLDQCERQEASNTGGATRTSSNLESNQSNYVR
jgi:hypothetical protein